MSVQLEEINALEFLQLTFLKTHLEGYKGFIAGGCFKNLFENARIKDVDMFFANQDDLPVYFTVSKNLQF